MALLKINLTDHFKQWFEKTNTVIDTIGDIETLDTTNKDSLVEAINEIVAFSGIFPEWANVQNKPADFPPSAHTHPISDVTNLQTELDDLQSEIDAVETTLGSHSHVVEIEDVSGLATALASYKEKIQGTTDTTTYVISNNNGTVGIYSQGNLVFYVSIAGGAVFNLPVIVGDASLGTHAMNRNFSDARYLRLTGGTLSGNISIPNATSGNHALNRTTADGRYLQTGSYGLGGVVISETSSFNNVDVTGFYVSSVGTTLNTPNSGTRFVMLHQKIDATNAIQFAIELAGSSSVRNFVRTKISGSWSSWVQNITTVSAPSHYGIGSNWILQGSSNFNAVKFNRYFFYPTVTPLVVTLPGSPSIGDWVELTAVGVTEGEREWTIARNGSNIMGVGDDLNVDIPNTYIKLVYCDSTTGWTLHV